MPAEGQGGQFLVGEVGEQPGDPAVHDASAAAAQ